MKSWAEAEQDPALFWGLTPREIHTVLGGVAARLRRDHNDRAWLAWHVASLSRATKIPPLKNLLHEAKATSSRIQAPDEMMAITKAWLASRHKR